MTKNNCLFCDSNNAELIDENEFCYSRRDGYPVTPRHTLIIPKRHVASYFDLYDHEVKAMHQMLIEMKNKIQGYDETVSGFNIGVNAGEAAGQSIFHVHMHLIPRRKGDIDNPQGGVRGVIPNRRTYTRKVKGSQ